MGIKSWLQNKATKSQRNEVEAFLVSLRGADPEVLDHVLASTMYYAAYFEARGKNVYEMGQWIFQKDYMFFPLEIGQMIKAQQKQNTTSSTPGLMVWLFSARALLEPQLRLTGRDVWAELARATDLSEALADEMRRATIMNGALEISDLIFDKNLVPLGLERLER